MPGVPFVDLLIMVVVIPSLVTLLFGVFAFRRVTPLAYRCQRCGGGFTRPSHRGFPPACPLCKARDWSRAVHSSVV